MGNPTCTTNWGCPLLGRMCVHRWGCPLGFTRVDQRVQVNRGCPWLGFRGSWGFTEEGVLSAYRQGCLDTPWPVFVWVCTLPLTSGICPPIEGVLSWVICVFTVRGCPHGSYVCSPLEGVLTWVTQHGHFNRGCPCLGARWTCVHWRGCPLPVHIFVEWVLIATCKQLVWSNRIGRNMTIWVLQVVIIRTCLYIQNRGGGNR